MSFVGNPNITRTDGGEYAVSSSEAEDDAIWAQDAAHAVYPRYRHQQPAADGTDISLCVPGPKGTGPRHSTPMGALGVFGVTAAAAGHLLDDTCTGLPSCPPSAIGLGNVSGTSGPIFAAPGPADPSRCSSRTDDLSSMSFVRPLQPPQESCFRTPASSWAAAVTGTNIYSAPSTSYQLPGISRRTPASILRTLNSASVRAHAAGVEGFSTSAILAASTDVRTPGHGMRSPASGVLTSGSVLPTPKPGVRSSESVFRTPESGLRSSGSGLRTPGSGLRSPRSGLRGGRQTPRSSLLRTPNSLLGASASGRRSPGTGLRTPGSGFRTPLMSFRSPGSGLRIPGSARTPGGSMRTPGSANRLDDTLAPSTIVAVVEGRGHARGEVGIAALELRQPVLRLAQFTDTHTYTRSLTKLAVLHPAEILLPSTATESGVGRLVQESVSDACISAVHRRYFNEGRGLVLVRQLAADADNTLTVQLNAKYYCLAAASALIRYVEHVHNITYAPASLRVHYTSSENTLMIEHVSCRQLELVRGLDGGWRNSLFGALRHTKTPAGTRLLRATLLQPHAAVGTIQARLDALQYLVEHADLLRSLQSILGRFPDLDWLLSMCAQQPKEENEHRREQRLNYVIGLKNTLELLSPLTAAMHGVTDPLLDTLMRSLSCPGAEVVAAVVSSVVHDDARIVKGAAAMRTQRCYAVKSNINGLLDVARKIYSEIIDDITSHVAEVCEEHRLTARVGHNTTRGFHIIIPVPSGARLPTLPAVFMQVLKTRGSITCTTERLYQLDQRSRDTMREILIMSNVIISAVISEVRSRVVPLTAVAEAVAALDLLASLAHAASLGGWVKPKVVLAGEQGVLRLVKGRHPILDLTRPVHPVANDTLLRTDQRIMLITGPNMSGKSTYLRQVALIQILAQVGSFVPAEEAEVSVRDQLFALLGSQDSPENNASTFQMQMMEVSAVLRLCSPSTLVLLDELAVGTSAPEAASLGWAVTEALLLAGPAVIIATHFACLTRMMRLYPQIRNHYFATCAAEGGRHCLREGVTPVKHYGLSVAQLSALPATLLQHATQLAHAMVPQQQSPDELPEETARSISIYRLAHRVLALADAVLPPEGLEGRVTEQDSRGPEDTGVEEMDTTADGSSMGEEETREERHRESTRDAAVGGQERIEEGSHEGFPDNSCVHTQETMDGIVCNNREGGIVGEALNDVRDDNHKVVSRNNGAPNSITAPHVDTDGSADKELTRDVEAATTHETIYAPSILGQNAGASGTVELPLDDGEHSRRVSRKSSGRKEADSESVTSNETTAGDRTTHFREASGSTDGVQVMTSDPTVGGNRILRDSDPNAEANEASKSYNSSNCRPDTANGRLGATNVRGDPTNGRAYGSNGSPEVVGGGSTRSPSFLRSPDKGAPLDLAGSEEENRLTTLLEGLLQEFLQEVAALKK